jgi:hypothetical protein
MEKKYVFFKMTSAPIVDSDDDTDKNSVECQRFVITCTVKKGKCFCTLAKYGLTYDG